MEPRSEITVQQLAGPGVKGLDTDPPLYHFDVDFDQIDGMIKDPVGFLRDLGLDRDRGIAPEGNVNVITNFGHVWTDTRWERRNVDDTTRAKPKGCCYVSDDQMICHVHE